MHKKMAGVFVGLLIVSAIAMGISGQPRPYTNRKSGCDTINDTVLVGFDATTATGPTDDAWYFYCWLDDSASGVAYLTRYINSTAIETCAVILRPGKDFVSFAMIDSFMLIKADSSDIFCYELAK